MGANRSGGAGVAIFAELLSAYGKYNYLPGRLPGMGGARRADYYRIDGSTIRQRAALCRADECKHEPVCRGYVGEDRDAIGRYC